MPPVPPRASMPAAPLPLIVLVVRVMLAPLPPASPVPPIPPLPPITPSVPKAPAVPVLPLALMPSPLFSLTMLSVNVIEPPPCSVMPFWPLVTVTLSNVSILALPGVSLIVMMSNVWVWPSRIRPLPSSVMLTPAAICNELVRSRVQLAGKVKVALPLVTPARSLGKLLASRQLEYEAPAARAMPDAEPIAIPRALSTTSRLKNQRHLVQDRRI